MNWIAARRGSALVLALVIVLIIAGLAGALLTATVFQSKASTASIQNDEAQIACDAALEKVRRALWIYKTDGTYPWDQILTDHQSLSLNPNAHFADYEARKDDLDFAAYLQNYYATGINTANEAPLPADAAHFLGRTMPFGRGGFYAVVRDNDDADGLPLHDTDGSLLVYVTASLPDGTQRQIEALVNFQSTNYSPDSAIVVDGSILFNGTPDVLGARGTAHANGDIVLTGNPTFSVSANATGTIDEGSATPPPGGFNEGVPPIAIPDVDPTQFQSMSDYLLMASGSVVDNQTGLTVGSGLGSGWNGWKFSSGTWSLSGSSVPPVGTYYVDGNAKLTGAGSAPNRAMSVVAVGTIETSGNIKLTPVLTGTLLLAGGDIKLGGTAGAMYSGLIAAHEQIQALGTFDHQGVLLAKNAEDVYSLVSAGSAIDPDSQFGGTMSVTYEGGLVTMLPNPSPSVAVLNVRRLK